ncbi:hypothetical protein DICPUDRAFT_93501 [Dictyostelium purpureum]|uniref:C2H2-type domain-containing protein n=1 Tax=Dictyostelium purpureum TaxID=5786 RepID=F0Z8A1_DICPU|nr:uncharacterized protein DICPUDRAFT_93501 [Dictyostelium purpureum]EGC39894.1 hypothetical protein DICPUDRAFT_93501 [Dictyostelium purpureum]|eukprot:XP_003283645.1 hypothetical protein DICPUDRAFT_93501 [Dictyostelium purpureum]
MNNRNSNINNNSIVSLNNKIIPLNPTTKCIDCGKTNRSICSGCIDKDLNLCKNCHQVFLHGDINNNNNNNNNNNMNCNKSCEKIYNNDHKNNDSTQSHTQSYNNSFIGSPNASSCSTYDEFDYQDLAMEEYETYYFFDYHFDNISRNRLFTCPYLNCLKEGFNEHSLALHLLECHEEENLLNTYVVCPFCSYRFKDGKFVEHIKENHLNIYQDFNNDNHHLNHHNNNDKNNNSTDNLVS